MPPRKVKKDSKLDVAYVTLKKAKVSRTLEVTPGILLDLDAKGNPIGIEILSVSKMAPALKATTKKKAA